MRNSPRKLASSPACRKSRLSRGKDILNSSAIALQAMATALEDDFLVAVDKILNTRGSVIVCGIGKAGLVGRKISATLASTGTRSHFLHPAEAIHGDLGCVGPNDVVLLLSNSGSTEEIVRILPFLTRRAAGLIAITSGANSPLARASDITLLIPPCREACHHGLAPSTSTTMMMALGDALALVISESREFSTEDFAELHPGGALGKRLAHVEEAMRPVKECRVASASLTIREMLIEVAKPGRRTGAVMLIDDSGTLVGIFTDSDLAKLMERRQDADLDLPLESRMTKHFSAIQTGAKLSDAIDVMVSRKISELPVVDQDQRPIGLIDITDVLEIEHTLNKTAKVQPPSVRVIGATSSSDNTVLAGRQITANGENNCSHNSNNSGSIHSRTGQPNIGQPSAIEQGNIGRNANEESPKPLERNELEVNGLGSSLSRKPASMPGPKNPPKRSHNLATDFSEDTDDDFGENYLNKFCDDTDDWDSGPSSLRIFGSDL